MKARLRVPVVMALAAIGILAAPAIAATTTIYAAGDEQVNTYYTPRYTYYDPVTDRYYYAPSDTYYYAPSDAYVVPSTVTYVEPRITVRPGTRAEQDAAINNDVVDTLAGDSRLSGRIGVETYRNVVTLSGRVSTPGQVGIASRDAANVDGVDQVQNNLRTTVGDRSNW
jgi:BON domain